MLVLVLNCGSSSAKYQLIDMAAHRFLARGIVERIGLPGAALIHESQGGKQLEQERDIKDHKLAIGLVLETLTSQEAGVISGLQEIDAVGHRVAHGGQIFQETVVIDSTIKSSIEKLIELAPLHNPPNLLGIQACEELMPQTPQVAVFDTAFHQTIPARAYTYAIPYEYYSRYNLRRYGFHGTSHQYVASRVADLTGLPLSELRIISCHLGNGASIAAIKSGRSIDTSMGFTPLEGLVMGTRCGDLDPAVVTFLLQKENLTTEAINEILNKQSGVLGISELSSDFRDLEQAANEGNARARLALDVFVYRVKKYIGAYAAVLDGLDVLVFTAGLGENSPDIRSAICRDMTYLGINIDSAANLTRGQEKLISRGDSTCQVWVIPTNEELMIARETKRLVEANLETMALT